MVIYLYIVQEIKEIDKRKRKSKYMGSSIP